jgi:hypothetical protein
LSVPFEGYLSCCDSCNEIEGGDLNVKAETSTKMCTLILPIGPPGSGKSTFCNGLQQFMRAINRPCSVANLDPANDNIPYNATFDVRELVSVDEIMEREELGPNGGVLWAMEELEANFEWLEQHLNDCGTVLANHGRVKY